MKRGSLVVVGSGIKGVGHLTFETAGWIEQCDLVAYCVADPVTENWIRLHSRASIDLYTLYGNDKNRIDTYHGMVDAMVAPVRAGKDVCGIFYGHPGVFVHPSHKAIEILRSEGHRAIMAPAISALDCLFADLGIDPSTVGCQTLEATDMLIRQRPLMVESHVVLWQVGCVGDLGFNFAGYNNQNVGILAEYLERYYPPDHGVVNYQAAQYAVCPPVIERLPLRDLRTTQLTGISTLYVPPLQVRPPDRESLKRLGLIPVERKPRHDGARGGKTEGEAPADDRARNQVSGGDGQKVAVGGAAPSSSAYAHYMPTIENSGLAAYLAELSTNPRGLAEHLRNPELASRLYAELTDAEIAALLSRHAGRIRMAMKDRYPATSILHAVHDDMSDSAEALALRQAEGPPAPTP